MSQMQRRKGRSGEQELVRLLRDHLGDQITRNLEQVREGGADLNGTPFVLEVKRAKRPASNMMTGWWEQAEKQAISKDGVPCLAYRIDWQKWQFVLPLGVLHPGFSVTNTSLTVTLGLEEFVAVTRETISEIARLK